MPHPTKDHIADQAEQLTAGRLAYCPYLVLPRLAIAAMPPEWQAHLERLLTMADEAGMETPDYEVVLSGGEITQEFDEQRHEVIGKASKTDPWANYKYGRVSELCPGFSPALAQELVSLGAAQ